MIEITMKDIGRRIKYGYEYAKTENGTKESEGKEHMKIKEEKQRKRTHEILEIQTKKCAGIY